MLTLSVKGLILARLTAILFLVPCELLTTDSTVVLFPVVFPVVFHVKAVFFPVGLPVSAVIFKVSLVICFALATTATVFPPPASELRTANYTLGHGQSFLLPPQLLYSRQSTHPGEV